MAVLILYVFYSVNNFWIEEHLSVHSRITCRVYVIVDVFQLTGVGIMLTISLLRYRATVHPLKPGISRRKLKDICVLVYLVGFIAGCGIRLPACFIKFNDVLDAYRKFYSTFWTLFVYFFPTVLMGLIYYKIVRALLKQNKYMKEVRSNPMSAPDSFNIMRYIRNRRTFFVCFSIVFCYGIAHIPVSGWFLWEIVGENHERMKNVWVKYFAYVLRVAGSHSVNPLIYGILDKNMFKILKFYKNKRRVQENLKIVVAV